MNSEINATKTKMEHRWLNDDEYAKWTDWKWQVSHCIKDVSTIEKILDIRFSPDDKVKYQETIEHFPMSITPYYLSLVDPDDYQNDPVFKQAFPDTRELKVANSEIGRASCRERV